MSPARSEGAAEIGPHKLLLFPEKLAALLRGGPDTTYPVSVELSLTNRCNQNCLWCSDQGFRQRFPDRLDMGILQKLFADLAEGGTRGLTIEGGGEPTLADFFEEAVGAARARGLAVGLISNGLFSIKPGLYEQFEWVRISLDAADRRQYQRLKGRDGFDQVLETIGRLALAAPATVLGAGYVLTNENDEPEPLRHLARTLAALGVDYLHVRPVVDHPELVSRRPPYFLQELETPEFSVNLAALSDNAPGGNNALPCLAHSLSTVIGADGSVWLCGRLNTEGAVRPLGSLLDASFRDIWLGPERAAQAALAASPQFCQSHCPQCRMTKYNQILADLGRVKTRNFI